MAKFCVNLSTLFAELPFLDRFAAAREAGFEAVEFWWPRNHEPAAVRAAASESDLAVVLINFDGGDLEAGERGLLSDPDRIEEFRDGVETALLLGKHLGCTSFNALVGLRRDGQPADEQYALACESVKWAAEKAAAQDASVLIEPLNPIDIPRYLLGTTDAALDFIGEVGRDNVRLQFDAYHAALAGEDIVDRLGACAPWLGHVQVADVPGRHQPGSGELDFPRFFAELQRIGYSGHVGLEYLPAGPTAESFEWLGSI
jgi:hydroxypyruvate isomerase